MSTRGTRGTAVDGVKFIQVNYDSSKSLQQASLGCFGGVII